MCTSPISAAKGDVLVWHCESDLQPDTVCTPTVKPRASRTHISSAHTHTHTDTRAQSLAGCRNTVAAEEFSEFLVRILN